MQRRGDRLVVALLPGAHLAADAGGGEQACLAEGERLDVCIEARRALLKRGARVRARPAAGWSAQEGADSLPRPGVEETNEATSSGHSQSAPVGPYAIAS